MERVTFRFLIFRSAMGSKERSTRKLNLFIDELFNDALSITRTMSKCAWQQSNSHFIKFTLRSPGNSSVIIHRVINFCDVWCEVLYQRAVTGLACSLKHKNANFLSIIKCVISDFPWTWLATFCYGAVNVSSKSRNYLWIMTSKDYVRQWP